MGFGRSGVVSAILHTSDHDFSATVNTHVRNDRALDRVEVARAFDRGEGHYTVDRFTGKASRPASWAGRRLASRFDGYWNLPEGDPRLVERLGAFVEQLQ
jgi:hypothetical protein